MTLHLPQAPRVLLCRDQDGGSVTDSIVASYRKRFDSSPHLQFKLLFADKPGLLPRKHVTGGRSVQK